MDFLDEDFVPTSAVARMQKGHERSFRNRLQKHFMENQRSSFLIRSFNLFIKILSCVLYCIRVVLDNSDAANDKIHKTNANVGEVFYQYLIRVRTDEFLIIAQTIVAILSLAETIIIFYISYKGSIARLLLNTHFLVELITDLPLLFITFIDIDEEETKSKRIYVPIFLNCWLAHGIFTDMVHNMFTNRINNKNSALIKEAILLVSTLICLIFTCTCGIEHLQRGGVQHFTLFTSFYFVIVTFSTVGYGDLYPDMWLSQLFVVCLIFIVLILLPTKINALIETMNERHSTGKDFVRPIGSKEHHVVVNTTFADAEFMNDFLNEFYAHKKHINYLVFLLAPNELDHKLKLLLKIPKWSHRVFHIRGTALSNSDLERVCINTAKACFILSARHKETQDESDEHTILRSWAVKDYAPDVPQYVHVFRPESKMFLEHARVVVCEDELKFSLLANNCITPGMSTYVTLLMHTTRGAEGQRSNEEWQKSYGFHSGNEVYDIVAEKSHFFRKCIGRSFLTASYYVHRRYGICLLGVKPNLDGAIILINPGPTYTLSEEDTLYYMGLTNEEALISLRHHSIIEPEEQPTTFLRQILNDFRKNWSNKDIKQQMDNLNKLERAYTMGSESDSNQRTITTGIKSLTIEERSDSLVQMTITSPPKKLMRFDRMNSEMEMEPCRDTTSLERKIMPAYCEICREECIKSKIIKSLPTVTEYIETTVNYCHMMKEKRPRCCLQLMEDCEHYKRYIPKSYSWPNPIVIMAVDRTSTGLLHLITPLRTYKHSAHQLRTIIFLLDPDNGDPDEGFLDMIASFPLIFWMAGKVTSTDSLLKAGIHFAEHIIITKDNIPLAEDTSSIYLSDAKTVVVAQKIYRMFPKVKLIAELNYPSNMRFVHFDPCDIYTKQQEHEKRERDLGSNLYFMFRLPFAEGTVLSANMLDRLLYQSSAKPYLVDLLKILLGMQPCEGSGHLTFINITEEYSQYRTYGSLYKILCSSMASIPIGIYRTRKKYEKTVTNALQSLYATLAPSTDNYLTILNRRRKTQQFLRSRMDSLGIMTSIEISEDGPQQDLIPVKNDVKTFSCILINPSPDTELEIGDLVYVIQSKSYQPPHSA